MAIFESAEAVYETIGTFCQAMADDPELGPQLASLEMVFTMSLTKPTATISLNCRQHPAALTVGGPGDGDLVLSMTADNIHRLWLGELNPMTGLATRKIKAKGDVMKAMGLAPILDSANSLYRKVLADIGRADLL